MSKPGVSQHTLFLNGFCFNFLPSLHRWWAVTWKWKPKESLSSLHCFWSEWFITAADCAPDHRDLLTSVPWGLRGNVCTITLREWNVYVTQARVIWEEGTWTEKMPQSNQATRRQTYRVSLNWQEGVYLIVGVVISGWVVAIRKQDEQAMRESQ